MKIRLHYTLLFTLSIAFGFAGNAAAQDAGMSDIDIIKEGDRLENEKLLTSPGEAEVRFIPKAGVIVLKDSANEMVEFPAIRHKTEPAAKSSGKQKHQDDSILSFNFLYYIIQKYKLQDIVD